MTDRTVVYRLKADVAGFRAQMAAAGNSVTLAANKMTAADASGRKFRAGLSTMGAVGGKAALVAAVGMGAAAKAAVDWETQWTGVLKTVDGSRKELQGLEGDLRGLAKTMPVTHGDIAATAEAAGQLGVVTKDVAKFTATMLQLGISTNMTADEAAISLSQFANVMGTSADEVDNLGAALVDLGNNSETTERDILLMGQRISKTGKQVGLAESDVLGLAAAMASAGIQVEAGGSATSRVFQKMAIAVKGGGEKLKGFSKVSGVTSKEFVKAFEDDPARAFAAFTKGLDGINKSGGDVFSQLKALGLQDVRVTDALLAMAGSGDSLTESLDLSAEAFAKNTALTDEYAKKAATTSSKATVAMNQMRDAGIEFGDVLLPPLGDAAERVGKLATAFGDLPGPLQKGVVYAGGLTTILGGGAWATSKVVNGIADMREAVTNLGSAFQSTGNQAAFASTKMRLMAAGAGVAVIGLSQLADESTSAGSSIQTFGNTAGAAMIGWSAGGPIGAAVAGGVTLLAQLGSQIKTTKGDIEALKQAMSDGDVEGIRSGIEATERSYGKLDSALRILTSTSVTGIALQATLGRKAGESKDALLAEAGATARAAQEAQAAAVEADLLADGMKFTAQGAREAADGLAEFDAAAKAALGDLSVQAGMDAVQSSLHQMTAAIESNGKSFKGNSEAALANRAALRRVAVSAVRAASSMEDSAKASAYLGKVRTDFTAAAKAAGVTAAAAQSLADAMGLVPRTVKTDIRADDSDFKGKATRAESLVQLLDTTTAVPTVKADTVAAMSNIRAVQTGLSGIQSKSVTVTVRQNVQRTVTSIQQALNPYVNAEGGYYAFANGGDIPDGHWPQMTRHGGPIRVWNEEETRGESYIPHANDYRRPRAKSILEDTAELFGGEVFWYSGGGIEHYASGGSKGSGSTPKGSRSALSGLEATARKLDRALEKQWASLEKSRDALDRERSTRRDLAHAVRDQFRSDDLFGDRGNTWAAASSGLDAAFATLRSDIAGARQFGDDIKRLGGLRGAARRAVMSDADAAHALANASRAERERFQRLYSRRERLSGQVGGRVGDEFFAKEIREQTREVRQQTKQFREDRKELRDLNKGVRRVEREIRRGHHKTATEIAHALGRGTAVAATVRKSGRTRVATTSKRSR